MLSSTPALFLLTLCLTLASALLANFSQTIATIVAMSGLGLMIVTGALAAFRALRGAYLLIRAIMVPSDGIVPSVLDVVGNTLMALLGGWFALLATFGFARGRQLRRRGKVLLPLIEKKGDWTLDAPDLRARHGLPAGLADQWRENGRTEHASVAAFARLSLDLIALGAPPRLIASANQDALDEVRHTELCFGLARAIDGRSLGPAPFPEAQRVATLSRNRTMALAKLAVDSLIDGALHEGVSARVVAKLAQRCEVPEIRAMLKEIAADEGRHSANGWAAVRWCLDEGGTPVASALLGAVRALPAQVNSELPEAARDGSWERFGIHGTELERREYAAALTNLRERVAGLIAAPATRAA